MSAKRSTVNDGNWYCECCRSSNTPFKERCQNCSAPRPPKKFSLKELLIALWYGIWDILPWIPF